jgi:uncharacterized protein YprB with RNaseH-like and TPR domain
VDFFKALTNGPYLLGPELIVTGERELLNDAGMFQLIEMRTEQVDFTFPQVEGLGSDLCLIYGIGPTTAQKLRQDGYQTVYDLLEHPRWRRAAQDLIKTIEARDTARLAHYGASDFQLLSFFQPETIRFIDIETLGLYYIHPVFLIGVLQFENGYGQIRQYLARDFSEEKAILVEISKNFKKINLYSTIY